MVPSPFGRGPGEDRIEGFAGGGYNETGPQETQRHG